MVLLKDQIVDKPLLNIAAGVGPDGEGEGENDPICSDIDDTIATARVLTARRFRASLSEPLRLATFYNRHVDLATEIPGMSLLTLFLFSSLACPLSSSFSLSLSLSLSLVSIAV